METSEQINELVAALSAFQGDQGPVLKTAINNAFARGGSGGSKYATLADCAESHKTMAKHGLAFMQGIHGTEFIARIAHKSGQWSQIRVPVPGDLSKMTIQQLGAVTTYLRRQTYSLVGLVADDDDDGNEAAKVGGWDHQPAGDLGKRVDTKLSNKWAKALMDAQDAPQKLASIWLEVKADHDLAKSVWATMPRAMKDRITDADKEFNPRAEEAA